MAGKNQKLLDSIEYPADLKKIPPEKLPDLCREIRDFLIGTVSRTGGHFGSNLGVVELTVALHWIFNTPRDVLIWDVGHQAYTHKILTGRKNRLKTIRQLGGLAPFPKREESEYDHFSVGHSSTSISAAVGMALAERNEKKAPKIIAVIGDGALGGGMAFEALNHAGDAKADILVVLNDNRMSISPNVGGLSNYLTRLISSDAYLKFREKGRKFFSGMPALKDFMVKAESRARGLVTPGTIFEELGFEYFGPVDGHDTGLLLEIFENLKKIKGPRILHVITKKGKGYAPAENDRYSFHAVSPFDPDTGEKKENGQKKRMAYTDVFSAWLVEAAEKNPKLHCITPAMCQGSGVFPFSQKFPDRYHDTGIAEQHSLTLAAGLAARSKKPVVAIYSSFLQRAYDQLLHDIAFQKLGVLLAIDRAGIVGPDGATHAGIYDLSFLRTIPGLVVMTPASQEEMVEMLEWGVEHPGPVAVRYPRDEIFQEREFFSAGREKIKLGRGRIIMAGKKLAILSFGTMLKNCFLAAQKLGATLVDMRFVKPLDEKLLENLSRDHAFFLTVEDNILAGGAGSAVSEAALRNNLNVRIKNLGIGEEIIRHGERGEILAENGLSEEKIWHSAERWIGGNFVFPEKEDIIEGK